MSDWNEGPAVVEQESGALPAVVLGEVVGTDDQRKPVVRWENGPTEGQSAEVTRATSDTDWAASNGARVALVFEGGSGDRPIVLAVLGARPDGASIPDAVRLESSEELVIECGKAKIAMRADGRIEIRGGYLISRSTGANKIKGGSVHIN